MKLPRKLIIKLAYNLYEEQGEFTQYELHDRIEQYLGRTLTVSEKRRITQILRNEFIAVRTERDRNQYRIYTHFIL